MADIPVVSLGEVASLRSGYAFKSSDWKTNGIPVVKIANVKGGRLNMSGCSFVDKNVAQEADEFRLRAGDILIAMTGYIGEVARVRPHDLPALLNQRVGRFTVHDPKKLDYGFLYQLLTWRAIRSEIEGLGYGSAQPNVSPTLIGSIKVPLPSLREQRSIASILGALDDKIDLNQRMNKTLEAMARAIFKDWFVDFGPTLAKVAGTAPYFDAGTWSLFPEQLDQDGMPMGWQRTPLIELCHLKRGYDLPTAQRKAGAIPIISSSGVSGYHDSAMADGPGVVTGRYGTIGEVFYVEGPFWPLNTALYVCDYKGNSRRFVFHTLRGLDFGVYSDKGAVPGINRNHLHLAAVTLPPRPVQEAFEKLLAPAWQRAEQNRAEAETLSEARDLLLPKLMSGELRIREAEKTVEKLL